MPSLFNAAVAGPRKLKTSSVTRLATCTITGASSGIAGDAGASRSEVGDMAALRVPAGSVRAVARHDHLHRAHQDAQVQPQRAPLDVAAVEVHTLLVGRA